MADIELVIKISEGLKNDFESEQWTALSCMEMKNALEKATPLPKGHGRLIDADKVKKDHMRWLGYLDDDMIFRLNSAVDKILTVIEADKGETE